MCLKTTTLRSLVLVPAVFTMSGCDSAESSPPDALQTDDGFSQLVTASWTRQPGREAYRCARVEVSQDMYVNSFRTLSPLGTHHAVVSLTPSSVGADREYDCTADDLQHSMLYASGVGTDDLTFPDGVAVKIPAGSQIHLNLHTFNVSDDVLSGTSGVSIKTIPESQVREQAEVVFGGTTLISLEDKLMPQSVSGDCVFTDDATIIALWPHMHQLGQHMLVSHGETTLLDMPFSFTEQTNYSISPTLVRRGEKVSTTCTYVNDTGGEVGFGDSSTQEMCFVGMYRYPATGAGLFSCTDLGF